MSQQHHQPDDELAALQSIGLADEVVLRLPASLTAAYREAVAAAITAYVQPTAPPPSLRARLLERVANFEKLKPAAEVRTYDEGWRASGIPGIDLKLLFKDQATGRTTTLVRMAPGASYPSHFHHDDEQCLVLKGDVRWADQVFHEGDFVVTRKDSTHPRLGSATGNLLLIIAGHTEFVD